MVEETKEPKKVAAEITGEGQAIPVRHRAKFVPDETLMSHELRKKLWDGLIPLKIDLALGDIITMEKPRSLYVSWISKILTKFSADGSKGKLPILHS